jgi:DNA-binding protein YbaB
MGSGTDDLKKLTKELKRMNAKMDKRHEEIKTCR